MPEPPQTGDAVLELVRKAELADDDVINGFLTRSGPIPPTASDTATQLVKAGILTPFQARLILQGRYKGFKLGPYKILNQIGAGGMGQVFLAEHTALRRRVALKVLPNRQALDRANVERFYREARAAAALDHPNIVRAHDVAFDKGSHFLVLEYIDGQTIDRKLEAAGRIPVGEAVGYIVQAATGLQHAHDKGVAHRDIKPSNLLVGRDGVVKILDMGLARFFEDENDNLTRQHGAGVMGTADYVAPEQLLNSAAADHRSDIYNLGATLYHLLTGRTPFIGTTTAKLLAHQITPVPPAHEVCVDIPEELSTIIAKMMAKIPGDRYQSAAEVIQVLLPFVDTPDPTGKSSGKLPPIAAAAISQATANLQPALERAKAAAARKRRKKQIVIAAVGGVLLLTGVIALAVSLGNNNDPPPDKKQPEQPQPPVGPQNPPISPKIDGSRILTFAYRPNIGEKTQGEAAVFTPDGKYLLISGGDQLIHVFNAADGKPVRQLKGHKGNVRTIALVPGNKPLLLSGCTDKTIKLWDYEAGGPPLHTYTEQNAYITQIAALPDGNRFLASADNGTIWQWSIDKGEVLKEYTQAKLPVYGLAVTKDGKRAVAGTWDSKRNSAKPEDLPKLPPVHVWWFDVESGKEGRRVTVPASVAHVNLSPDDRFAVFGTADGISKWELDRGGLQRVTGTDKRITCPIFSKNGRYVLSTGHDKSFHIWELRTGTQVAVEPGMPGPGYHIGLSPDGKRAAVVGAGGGAFVWNLPAVVAGK
ncbi:MAG: serine/threonine protein kinase [Planctomycetia bacterium]|nr:serine/threonine protein kinase [Planctomycetia bacterium]